MKKRERKRRILWERETNKGPHGFRSKKCLAKKAIQIVKKRKEIWRRRKKLGKRTRMKKKKTLERKRVQNVTLGWSIGQKKRKRRRRCCCLFVFLVVYTTTSYYLSQRKRRRKRSWWDRKKRENEERIKKICVTAQKIWQICSTEVYVCVDVLREKKNIGLDPRFVDSTKINR